MEDKNKVECERFDVFNTLITDSNCSIKLPKQRKVMFRFDNDEPVQINTIHDDGEFTIKMKEGFIRFENNGKKLELYIE
jgi:hypothetical protein